MKRTFLALLSAILLITSAKAEVITDSIHSTIMNEWVRYNVYLPPSFHTDTRSTYPILYLLHGLSDTYRSWTEKGRVQDVADALIREDKIREMVIIMPNAGGPDIYNTWNGYFNMPGHAYHDFFFRELLPTVEKRYRITSDKGHRAISGLSMGGGGSVVYCQTHPEMFSSCYAMSAWLDSSPSIQADTVNCLFHVTNAVRAHSAPRFMEQADEEKLSALRTVKWFFDTGDDDFLLEQTERLHMLMRQRRVAAELRVRDGGHSWNYWHSALYTSLPFASRNFSAD